MPTQRILIADDNLDFRKMMRYQLEVLGYEVVEAEDGNAALRTALEMSLDLVLLDCHMPEMDGVEVAQATLAARPGLPVLFITGDFELTFLRKLDLARTHVLQKPFDIEDLQENIHRLLH